MTSMHDFARLLLTAFCFFVCQMWCAACVAVVSNYATNR